MLLHTVIEFGNGNFLIAVREKERTAAECLVLPSLSGAPFFFNKTTKLSSLYPISTIGLDYFTF